MILTITLNPLLEKRYIFHSIDIGDNNRTNKTYFSAGGKGINVSRQLNHLGVKNLAFTFLGGNNGKIFKNLLSGEQIDFTSVQTKSETREASLIMEKEKQRLTTFFGPNSVVTKNEADEFTNKMIKMIENCEIVIFSGSSPCKETDDIFPAGIELANKFDKISICDTYGSHLQNCIDANPIIIHNNVSEISKSLNENTESENRKLEFLHRLYCRNIKQIFLTDGANPVYASNFDFIYKANCPSINEIDSTGSGDAFTAGIVYGLHHSHTFENSLRYAVNLGTANAAEWEVCKCALEKLNFYDHQIHIQTLGKKINTI